MNSFSHNRFTDKGGGLKRRLSELPSWVTWVALTVAAVALVFVGWLGFDAVGAKSNLEQARSDAQQAKEALLAGKTEDATRWAENAQFHAREAQTKTNSLPWTLAAAVPFVGSPLKTTQQISDIVVSLANDVLMPAAKMGATVSPDKLINGTRIDLQLLRAEQIPLTQLSEAAAKVNVAAQGITRPAYIGAINTARSELQNQTARLAQLLNGASLAARLAPSMMGADGPRTYLMAFQTNAEARGTGGLAGAFALLRFNDGTPSLDTFTTNLELHGAKATVDLGPEFNKVYEWTNAYNDFRNSNQSAHFPYAAQIWRSMWQEKSGMSVDGVIALDPVALSYILGAIGPVTIPGGEVITQDNVVELTQATIYSRFPLAEDQTARKDYLQIIAKAIAQKAMDQVTSAQKLLDALGKAAGEGRLAVWSASPADQALLDETPLAHTIPDDDAPYAQVVINNLSGTKMDYYLKREIEYQADGCAGDMRNSTVTVRLANTATETSVPPFYAETSTWPNQPTGGGPYLNHEFKIQVPRGSMIYSVRVIATKGARLMSATVNGQRTAAITNVERGHPTFEVQIVIPPGQSGELAFRLSEPTSDGDPRVPVQPLVDNVRPTISVPAC